MPDSENQLLYGDNLAMLRRHIADSSVDLVYLDPPFKSDANYNMLFREQDGSRAAAQIQAFADTWQWDSGAAAVFDQTVDSGGEVAKALLAFQSLVPRSDMLAYLSMMAPRLVELRRVLKPTGSLYLHCDPTASHYLKLLLDAVFSPKNFRSEIVWKRSSAHSDAKQGRKNYGHIHDVLLFYTRSETWTWNDLFTPYDTSYLERDYRLIDEETGRRFRRGDLTAAKPGGDTEYDWRVKKHSGVKERWIADLRDEYVNPRHGWEYKAVRPYSGRYWAYSKENMRQFASEGRLRHTFDGRPEYKRFLDEMLGVPLQDLWTDIPPIIAGAAERLGYPTQKPEALLERLISVSSHPGDVVLDAFCGCGTAVASAQRLGRRWIGIDITYLAVGLIRQRLEDTYGKTLQYALVGKPTTAADAVHLAKNSPLSFQDWVLEEIRAQPAQAKRGADRGIDGVKQFRNARGSRVDRVLISVKSGHVQVSQLRDLHGVIAREKAAIGVMITIEPPTRAMREEAASAGFFQSDWGKHPRLQILTIEDIFAGKSIDYPRATGTDETFKRAPKARRVPRAVEQDLFNDALAGTALSRQRKAPVVETRRTVDNASKPAGKLAASRQPSIKPAAARKRSSRPNES